MSFWGVRDPVFGGLGTSKKGGPGGVREGPGDPPGDPRGPPPGGVPGGLPGGLRGPPGGVRGPLGGPPEGGLPGGRQTPPRGVPEDPPGGPGTPPGVSQTPGVGTPGYPGPREPASAGDARGAIAALPAPLSESPKKLTLNETRCLSELRRLRLSAFF